MADSLSQGRLAKIIVELRQQGLSFDRIARRLEADYGIFVSSLTVSRWHDEVVGAAS